MRALRALAIVAAAGVVATPAVAQVSIGAAGLYASLNGSDFDGTDAGFGLDAQVRFPIGSSASLGFGGQWTSHGVQGATNNLTVLGVFGEPRFMFTTAGSVKPYLMARGGYVRESFSESGFDASASGYYVGGGGGLVLAAGSSLTVDLAVFLNTVSFGDVTVNGSKVSNSNTSGSALVVRAGIVIGLGK
ncbi:MAG: hypothetical protein ACREA0_21995 [bacterium]